MAKVHMISPYKTNHVHLSIEYYSEKYVRIVSTVQYVPTEECNNDPLILYSRGLNLVQVVPRANSKLHARAFNHPYEDSRLEYSKLPPNGKITIITHVNPSKNNTKSGLFMEGQNLIIDCSQDGLAAITYFIDTDDKFEFTIEVTSKSLNKNVVFTNCALIKQHTFIYNDQDLINLRAEGVFKIIKPSVLLGIWQFNIYQTLGAVLPNDVHLNIANPIAKNVLPAYEQSLVKTNSSTQALTKYKTTLAI